MNPTDNKRALGQKPNRRQTAIKTNAGQGYWRMYKSLDLDEFVFVNVFSLTLLDPDLIIVVLWQISANVTVLGHPQKQCWLRSTFFFQRCLFIKNPDASSTTRIHIFKMSDRYMTALWVSHCCIKAHGPLTRYVKLRVAHALGMPRTFSQPPNLRGTAS